ncbi:hypothetical protein BOX15_Mlig019039g1 [Macrostomum lignano]|uniref:Uncharacterized protein n=1 Tax=Macrostomum lignano TaxID=282301 RepID=A0A267H6N0_9PLAT|nr:hypothetical protein BOX15_Mlig019039g1 [Macrostomum lignano]
MMLQAASRQQSGSLQHHQHQHYGGSGSRHHQQQQLQPPHRHQRLPQLQPEAPGAKSPAISMEAASQSSGRLASALLFLAVLVLMVDASRIILYSWYTDGSYLKYLYGADSDIRWTKCDPDAEAAAAGSTDFGWTTPAPGGGGFAITAISLKQTWQKRQKQRQQPENLDQFKASLVDGLLVAGTLANSAVASADSPAAQRRIRRLAKPLVRALFHASTVACLFLLAVAIFPAALRSHRGGCLLTCSLLFSLATLLAAGAAIAASLLTLFFFSASELQPRVRPLYSFVPQCDALRRAFLGAECFSLIVVCSAVCILLRLKVFFCRVLCSRCCPPGEGDGDGGGNGDIVGGYRNDEREFAMARRSLGGGYAYDDEEFLA